MKKFLTICLIYFSFMQLGYSQDSDSLIILAEVSKAVKEIKKKPLAVDKVLRKSVQHYSKSRDKIFVVKLLKNYEKIFRENNQHYVVEMFFPLFKKDKSKFKKLLDESLSQKDKAEFLERLKIVAREDNGGNG